MSNFIDFEKESHLIDNEHIKNIINNDKIIEKIQETIKDIQEGVDDVTLEINFKTKNWWGFGSDMHIQKKNHKIKGDKYLFMDVLIKVLNIYKSKQLDELHAITKDPDTAYLFREVDENNGDKT